MTSIASTLCALVFVASLLTHDFAEGRPTKGTLKTIMSEGGDIIDCVNIYRQPAFDHPLLKNHKIQMRPTSRPSGMRSENSLVRLDQVWQRNGQECPKGTIPIKRTTTSNLRKNITFNQSLNNAAKTHEWAVAYMDKYTHYGARAVINVWNPTTVVDGLSVSQIWVASPSMKGDNTIEAGWIVNPQQYGDSKTRFFLYWTRDGYEDTGCYDLNCPGFVQTTSDFTVGIPLQPVSTYNQQQYDIEIVIHQDKATKHWWVTLQDIDIGYYPAAIFTGLWESASLIQWGGEIDNVKVDGYHTITQMGSGHFPIEGYAKASYFRHVSVVDESNTLADASFTGKIVTNPPCYDLLYGSPNATYGTYFYYGGPSFSATCR